jgi:hypothetical protein
MGETVMTGAGFIQSIPLVAKRTFLYSPRYPSYTERDPDAP